MRAGTSARAFSRQAGFTLFEAMAALALTATIVSVLASLTSEWLPRWRYGFERTEQAERLGVGLRRLVRDLEAAEFISPYVEGRPLFDGTKASVVIVRTAIGPGADDRLEIVKFIDPMDGDQHGLIRAKAPYVPPSVSGAVGASKFEFADPVVVVPSRYRVSFAYAGPERIWRDDWRGRSQLPSAIAVRVHDASTGRILVSTAALLHVNASSRCAVQATVNGCADVGSPEPGK